MLWGSFSFFLFGVYLSHIATEAILGNIEIYEWASGYGFISRVTLALDTLVNTKWAAFFIYIWAFIMLSMGAIGVLRSEKT